MQYILDTHILLWWLNGDKKLDNQKIKVIADPDNIIFISAVNIWEIEIKKALGKLSIPNLDTEIIRKTQFTELPIHIKHVLYLPQLPDYHKDPFDRLLICQCITEGCTLITEDQILKKYPIMYL